MITVILLKNNESVHFYRSMSGVPRPGDIVVLEKTEKRHTLMVLDQPYHWYPDREDTTVAVSVEELDIPSTE